MKWFRLYHDLPNDRKLKRFSTEQKWAWVVLLCVASESSQRGLIHDEDEEDLADHCGFESKQDFQYFLDKLRQKGMIEHIEGGIKITHWDERQYSKPSDLPEATKQRKRKQREKERVIQNQNVTSDTSVTLAGHSVMSRHTDTDSDTDSDTEKDSLSPKGSLSCNPEEREGSHSLKEPELIVAEPDYAPQLIAPINGPIQKPQCVALPSASSQKPLPPWRLSWGIDDFDPGFCEDVLQRMQKQWPDRTLGDAIARIANAERVGRLKRLEADYSAYCDHQLAIQPPIAAPLPAPADAQAMVSAGLPQDLSEAIVKIQAKLAMLSWTHADAARWMQSQRIWGCERGGTKAMLSGGNGFARLDDRSIFELLEALEPLQPGQCIPTLQPA
jgi:hypothetical protein